MQFAADIFALSVCLFVVQQWLRHRPPNSAYLLFVVLPFVLTPMWALGSAPPLCHSFGGPLFFCWLKTYSVSVAACWLTRYRFFRLETHPMAQLIALLLLPVNMLEAVIQGACMGTWPQYLNAVAGLLLVITLPFSNDAFQARTRGRARDLDYDGLTRAWIIGYTIWNWVFVYLLFPVIAGQQLAVLGTALAVGLLNPSRWLQARTYTLAIGCYMLFTVPDLVLARLGTADWSNPTVEFWTAFVSLAFMSILAFIQMGIRLRLVVRDLFSCDLSCRRISFEH